MRRFFFILIPILGFVSVTYAEDVNNNNEINFNDPAFIEKVNENMYFSSPDEFHNLNPDAERGAQNVILGGSD
jgi:hypothetical protein